MKFSNVSVGQKFLAKTNDGGVSPIVNIKLSPKENPYFDSCGHCGGSGVNYSTLDGFEGHNCGDEEVLSL